MSSSTRTTNLRSHFGLTSIPFTREFPVAKRWHHSLFDEQLAELRFTVEQRMSAVIIGPAGCGKTVMLRTLADSLPEARYRIHYVKVTCLSKRDFCKEIAAAIGCLPAGNYGTLVRRIQERAQTLMDQECIRPVVVLDEVHDMRPEVLAILRVLTNFDMDSRLVVSLILAGQPALKRMLRREELESVSRRMAHYASLRLLSRDETLRYIAHRMQIAGADNEIFDDSALDSLYEIAQGNLRAIDRLALKSLEQAYRAENKIIGHEHVLEARKKVLP